MAAARLAKYVAEMTDGKFQIQVFAAGEIVPACRRRCDRNGTVEMPATPSPITMSARIRPSRSAPRSRSASMRAAECLAVSGRRRRPRQRVLARLQHRDRLPCGNTGTQMGGWFRKEIKTVADLKGLKMRIGGFAGKVLAEARRRAAADRRRRHLSGAGKGHHRRGRVGRPV
jgi:TRAP-type mannitol/chloroaromatic compound transport system substrate-binding protein